ncbi:hypothetical protein [Pseudonocardia alni]|uniref:hypothetical protein n=1 Tax=Pseudonocardia alni TaxID=33907 RepID=UPI003326BEA4
MLPPLARDGDLAPFLSGTALPTGRAFAALSAASSLVRAYCGRTWVTDSGELETVPDPVVQATVFIARRVALISDEGASSETAGPFSVRRDTGMWMSATERLLLDPYRISSGVTSMSTRGPLGIERGDVLVSGDLAGSDPWVLTAEEIGR